MDDQTALKEIRMLINKEIAQYTAKVEYLAERYMQDEVKHLLAVYNHIVKRLK